VLSVAIQVCTLFKTKEDRRRKVKRTLTGILGIVLIVAGVAGLIFCLVGIIVLGQAQQAVETAAMNQLELVDRALTATTDGLLVADATLSQASAATQALEGTVTGLGQAMEGTGSTVDAVAGMIGDQLPATISVTEETLSGLAQTAQVVDDVLLLVSNIPILGLDQYDPAVPLSQGIQEVVSSLAGIPTSLGNAEAGLTTASGSLETMQSDITVMASEIAAIVTSLQAAGAIIEEYLLVVAELQALVSFVRTGLPDWLLWSRVGLSLVLVWLGIAQFGLITQGWELLARSRKR
jgi:hypothetical protein